MKMSNEKIGSINTMVNSILTIAYGVMLLTNVLLNGVISQTVGNWYELLAILFILIGISNACFRNAPQYIILIFSYVGAYLYLRISRANFGERGYFMNIPMLFLFIGIGFFISYFATKGNSGFLKTSIILIGVSIFFLIATYLDIYNLIVPALVIGISLIVLMYAIIKHVYLFSNEDKEKMKDKIEAEDAPSSVGDGQNCSCDDCNSRKEESSCDGKRQQDNHIDANSTNLQPIKNADNTESNQKTGIQETKKIKTNNIEPKENTNGEAKIAAENKK